MSLREEIELLCADAKSASDKLALLDTDTKNAALLRIAAELEKRADEILEANKIDVSAAAENGVTGNMLDRLTLTNERILGICKAVKDLVLLDDPVGKAEK